MIDVVLFRPEIPPNAGNVIRLCANTGAGLHLVEPLGFTLDDKNLRRAGLDYHDLTRVVVHVDWEACRRALGDRRLFAVTARSHRSFATVKYAEDDVFVFGPETAGLSDEMLAQFATDQRLRVPMRAGNRSLNLSNAVAVVVYEAWRQLGFEGGA